MDEPGGDPLPAGKRSLWNRLTFRLGAGLVIAAALVLAGTAWLNLALQQRHLLRLMETRADQFAEVILAATRGAMLDNDERDLLRIVETIAAQEGMQRIRIFDRQGRISYSNVAGASGAALSVEEMPCVSCHRTVPPAVELPLRERVRLLRDPAAGGRILEVMAPIPNEAQCAGSGCHAPVEQQHVLGVLDARLSLASLEDDLAASQRELALGVSLAVLATLAIAGWMTWRLVLRPVSELTSASERVASGDLAVRVEAGSQDEIGALARAWNHMADELAAARTRMEGWGAELERRVQEKTSELGKAQEQMMRVERLASLGRLSAEVAHEINNPLAGIAMYARLMQRRLGEPGAPRTSGAAEGATESADEHSLKIMEMIEQEARRCGQIVRNMLLFSRAPTSRVDDVDLQSIIERCCLLVRHKAELQEVQVQHVVAPGTPVIVGDAQQLQQMLLSLIVNAIEACGPEDSVTVTASPGDEPGWARLSVRDTGRGIAREHRNRLFEPFFSTKEETSGVGLGLAVVYGIIQRHGGLIDVVSELGMGTEMIVDLPPRPPAEQESKP